MSRKVMTRLAGVATAAGITSLALIGLAGPALAGPPTSVTLHPGQQQCVQQWANYQVRGDGSATAQGAKFKITYGGVAVPGTSSPGLVNYWAAELRTSLGTFKGQGYYAVCATNNGTADTKVTLQVRTDGEFN